MRIIDLVASFSIAILSLHIIIIQNPAQIMAQEKGIEDKNELIDSVIRYMDTHPLIWILNSNRSELCSSLNISNPKVMIDIKVDKLTCAINPNHHDRAYTIELLLAGHRIEIEAWKA